MSIIDVPSKDTGAVTIRRCLAKVAWTGDVAIAEIKPVSRDFPVGDHHIMVSKKKKSQTD
jgi:hypothetical protein